MPNTRHTHHTIRPDQIDTAVEETYGDGTLIRIEIAGHTHHLALDAAAALYDEIDARLRQAGA